MAGEPVFLQHPSSLQHDTGSHPEQPARITAIQRELERRDWLGFSRVSSPAAQREVLTRVHPQAYVDAIEAVSAGGGGHLDLDTVMSAGSYEAALHAAGGAVRLAEMLVAGDAPTGFSAHRPPGHHASSARAMGFCLFNSVAVAARDAIDRLGLERVMILDWDVHHGNGTNDIFHEVDDVLFVSIHQSPLYPGTGGTGDAGAGRGLGYTVNLPVPPGSGDPVYVSLLQHVVAPIARSYRPQLILLSAGYDAHAEDPLADCRVSDEGFATLTRVMGALGTELEAPVGAVLEGGYALDALARSVAATMEVLGRQGADEVAAVDLAPEAEAARRRLARWWPDL